MKTIALKFGGSSLATAAQFEKVRNIIEKNPARRYVVASAPGKRNSADTKVTDLLYLCYELAVLKENFESALGKIRDRFQDIIMTALWLVRQELKRKQCNFFATAT